MIETITDWALSIGAVRTRRPFSRVCRWKVLIEGRISADGGATDEAGNRGAGRLAAGAAGGTALPAGRPSPLHRLRDVVTRRADRRGLRAIRGRAGARARTCART